MKYHSAIAHELRALLQVSDASESAIPVSYALLQRLLDHVVALEDAVPTYPQTPMGRLRYHAMNGRMPP